MDKNRLPPDIAYEVLVRRARAERSRYLGEVLGVWLANRYLDLARCMRHLGRRLQAPAASDESDLAGARNYADLRARFHRAWTARGQRALDPG